MTTTANLKDELKSKAKTNGHSANTQNQAKHTAASQNQATKTLGAFDTLTDALSAKVTDNIALQVEKKVAEAIVSGELTNKIENRIADHILSMCQTFDDNYQLLEAQVEELDSPLALPSASDSSFRDTATEE